MHRMDRRTFLTRATAAAGALGIAATATHALGSNDTIRVAVVGVRGQGVAHIGGFESLPDVEVVALCDVDASVLNERAAKLEEQTQRKIARFGDVRKLLEDKSIDLLSIATPNHAHSQSAFLAETGR